MKKMLLLFLIIAAKGYAEVPSHNEIRLLYKRAASEERSCRLLIKQLDVYNEKNNPVLAGYRACATMIMAKYVFNPFAKFSNFIKGKKLLEKCIAENKTNIELRFLRFAVQTNAPSFLNYNGAIPQDKLLLVNETPKLTDLKLKNLILSLLMESDYLSLKEKSLLND